MTLTLAVALLVVAGSARAQTRFLSDGAVQNNRGGWDLPAQGTCPAGAANGYTGINTRPACSALRLNIAQASCTSANNLSWTTSGVCNDQDARVTNQTSCESGYCSDASYTTKVACEAALKIWTPKVDRLWNSATSVCAIVMFGDDRNAVECMAHNGTWVTTGTCTGNWVMPLPAAYTPNLITSNSPGDQCLRCHNKITQYNGARVRDTDDTRYMGHKNMSRPVKTGGLSWGGPPFSCTGHPADTTEEACAVDGGTWDPTVYPTDDTGNAINWGAGTIHVGTVDYALKWIYGDWLAALPRAIYADSSLNNMSYSCGRCHTTGWTSDAGTTPNAKKEPETTFPGITWNGTGTKGQVNLKGGVAGDANNMSSWDVWGISCTRCHSSAVDTASHGGVAPFTAPAAMSSHHTNLTAADFPGWCSTSSIRDQASCLAAAATWYSGYCTDTRFLGTGGITPAAAKTACETGNGLGPASSGVPLGTWVTPCSDNNFATAATCVSPATWNLPTSSCSVAGLCNDPAMTTAGTCAGTVATGPLTGLVRQWQATSDIVTCIDAGGKWTGSLPQRGQVITALCMQCHRQETSGLPNTNGSCSVAGKTTPGACVAALGTWTETGGGLPMLVGPYHSTVAFPSHPHAYQFLNSPHGKFTGKFSEVATAKYGSGYGSYFQFDSEAANTGAGCTTCHEVHTSTVAGEKPFRKECTECHAGPYNKDLTKINHVGGFGTPLEKMATEPAEACVTCHMPDGKHLFRINVDPSYSMFPMPAAITANVAPNATPDGAVWVDLDSACGQCHGGGTSTRATTGSITAASAVLTVANSTGFLPNEKIQIAGAGAFYYDDIGQSGKNTNFDTYIKSVDSATQITLAGAATKTVSGKAVVQNVTKNGALYYTKGYLATLAKGMHGSAGTSYPVTFSYATSGASVTTTAAVDCGAVPCPAFTYDWTWGDGSSTLGGPASPPAHAYTVTDLSGRQPFTISLTVNAGGLSVGSVSQNVLVTKPDLPSTASGNYSFVANTWTATLTDTSTDALTSDPSKLSVMVDWGDGSARSGGHGGGTFTHVYTKPGSFPVRQTVTDTKPQATSVTYGPATPGFFTIGGTVVDKSGTAIPGATVTVSRARYRTVGGQTVYLTTTYFKTFTTAADGTFSAGGLAPGTYTVAARKFPYLFGSGASIPVGPSNTSVVVQATGP